MPTSANKELAIGDLVSLSAAPVKNRKIKEYQFIGIILGKRGGEYRIKWLGTEIPGSETICYLRKELELLSKAG